MSCGLLWRSRGNTSWVEGHQWFPSLVHKIFIRIRRNRNDIQYYVYEGQVFLSKRRRLYKKTFLPVMMTCLLGKNYHFP